MAIDFYNAGMDFYETGKHKEAYECLIQEIGRAHVWTPVT